MKTNKYRHICKDIENKIKSNEFREYLPPVKDLISQYTTTQATISKALRILKQNGLLSYEKGIGNKINDNQQKNISGLNIGVMLPVRPKETSEQNRQHMRLLRGFCSGAHFYNSRISLFINSDRKKEQSLLSRLAESRDLDALVYFPLTVDYFIEKSQALLRKMKFPVITRNFHNDHKICRIDYTDDDIMKEIFKCIPADLPVYFISINYPVYWVNNREKYFQENFKLVNKKSVIKNLKKMYSENHMHPRLLQMAGYQSLEANFSNLEFPCVMIGVNDAVALGAMQYLLQKQISIPGQVSLFGIDCSSRAGRGVIASADLSLYRYAVNCMKIIHCRQSRLTGKNVLLRLPVKIISPAGFLVK
ncbi:MAG: hypothetical protein A2096_05795 [Spirochaetes bacterium GWF1_41_5]|nr:MAG: hypothetical protein A2096_05795 [Spirochaetes bacterium GWF1_41_5]HBE03642.1 hypothetical protein [Spirochaetia bacterium]